MDHFITNLTNISWFFMNYFHIQIYIALLLFCIPLKRRKGFPLTITVGTIFYCFLPLFFPNIFFWEGFLIGEWFTYSFILLFLLALLLIYCCFEISTFKELAFYGTSACIVQHFVHTLARIVNLAFSLEDNLFSQLIQFGIAIVVYILFYFIFVRRLHKGDDIRVKNSYLILFSAIAMFLCYYISLWTTLKETETIGSNVFDSFCCVLLLLLQFGLFEWGKIQKQNEIMMQILHMEKEQHAISKENIEIINMKCHDFKHQLSALRHLDNPAEQDKSIREIENAIMIYDKIAKTGNDTLDIILAEKSLYCEKNGIQFGCIVDGEKLSFMSEVDIYSVFGNALDNAIESVIKIENQEKRIISMNVFPKGNFLMVHMENYFEHPLVFEEGLPVTTKEDKDYHGYGMRSMRYITEKYKGTISILSENNIFSLNLLFPLTEE